ncbi:MAG: biotin--[Paludibacteraceae bacterium]|nr:biotin--[acetyl-CoA-carboxylase] ligase [Paludibacteraceae bacterium]
MKVQSTNSTNTLMRELAAKGEAPEFIYAEFQTEGRGQTGNKWESEVNKNLLCSILLPADEEPFYLTVAVSVALHTVVAEMIENEVQERMPNESALYKLVLQKDLTIKWPNDLYYKDSKLAGMLIEGAICGQTLNYAIAGIGLNVNQTRWRSAAPNPISLKTVCRAITGEQTDFDIDLLMERLYSEVQTVLQMPRSKVWEKYKEHLYRGNDGPWPFVERDVNMAPTMNAPKGIKGAFNAWIVDVKPSGELVLQDEEGELHTYHFKQIRYVI